MTVAKFITVHKCQSITVDHLVWVLDKFYCFALAYVPLGRCETFQGLHIVPTIEYPKLTTKHLNLWQDVLAKIHKEYKRLREGTTNSEAARIAAICQPAPQLEQVKLYLLEKLDCAVECSRDMDLFEDEPRQASVPVVNEFAGDGISEETRLFHSEKISMSC